MPGAPDAEARFDELEFLIAMQVLHPEDATDGEPRWFPAGGFQFRRRDDMTHEVTALLAKAREAGADYGPVKAGMFGGNVARLEAVARTSEASAQRMRRGAY